MRRVAHILAASCLALIAPGVLTAQAGGRAAAANDRIYYELGMSYLLQKRPTEALAMFGRAAAAGGELADAARLNQIRLIAREKRKKGAKRVTQVRTLLRTISDEDLARGAWYAGMLSLYDYGEIDSALDLALEATYRFEGSVEGLGAGQLAAEILYERGQLPAAREQLYRIIASSVKANPFRDDAHFWLARVYLTPGPYFSRRRAYRVLLAFQLDNSQAFRASLWRTAALKLLRELAGSD